MNCYNSLFSVMESLYGNLLPRKIYEKMVKINIESQKEG